MTEINSRDGYPLACSPLVLSGPTLLYIDTDGKAINLALTNEQVQVVIDAVNLKAIDESEDGEPAPQWKPPIGPMCTSTRFSPDGAGIKRDQHTYSKVGDQNTCIHCGTFRRHTEVAEV